jgi:hypothetical protein
LICTTARPARSRSILCGPLRPPTDYSIVRIIGQRPKWIAKAERGPLRSIEIRANIAAGVTTDSADSHEVGCSTECCVQPARGLIWVAHPCLCLVVSDGHLQFLVPAVVRRSLAQAVSSSRSFAPLQSTALSNPSRFSVLRPSTKQLPWGSFFPSSRHQPAASSSCRASQADTLRPRRFSRPRRFTPPLALWVCFAPQPRPGFSLQGFALRTQPRPPRR